MRILKKSCELLCAGVQPKYQVISEATDSVSIVRRCELLQVSRAGYYRWRRRVDQEAVDRDAFLLERIRSLHRRSHGILGFRRVHRLLERGGVRVAQRRVRRLMRKHGLFGRPSGRKSRYRSRSRAATAEDLLQRQFHADRPNHKWVSDISEFSTLDGKLYLCQVRDLYHGVIVGWFLDSRQTGRLVIAAASVAIRNRVAPKEIVFHSDRGVGDNLDDMS
ncbi:MAG: IS3 family transposase [Gammaproteobacteria bacterium]|nr:IS3 family transposase [Gammaproteobacteria bacterium]